MRTEIYFHKYLLHSREGLNSRSQLTAHEGALIKVVKNGVSGYGCLHPWVALGDTCLDELLLQIARGKTSRQVKCALECARIDRKSRALGMSLFEGLEIPDSHATIVGGIENVELAVSAGFDTIKIKMGRDKDGNLELLGEIHKSYPKLKVRIDFNGVSSQSQIEYLLNNTRNGALEMIDFLEDPFSMENASWEHLRDKYAVKFAIDRGVSSASGEFDVSVLKPAVNKKQRICDDAQMAGRSVVVTSYMDHPIGQTYAAYCAGKLNKAYLGTINKRCGLITHGLFEPTEFTEKLGVVSPTWKEWDNGSTETGLGFDDLLEKVDWKKI